MKNKKINFNKKLFCRIILRVSGQMFHVNWIIFSAELPPLHPYCCRLLGLLLDGYRVRARQVFQPNIKQICVYLYRVVVSDQGRRALLCQLVVRDNKLDVLISSRCPAGFSINSTYWNHVLLCTLWPHVYWVYWWGAWCYPLFTQSCANICKYNYAIFFGEISIEIYSQKVKR